MLKVVVLGNDVDSLLFAWIIQQHPNVDVTVVRAPGQIQRRDFVLPHTHGTHAIMRKLETPHSPFTPSDGILMRGNIYHYPRVLQDIDVNYSDRIIADVSTKLSEPVFVTCEVLAARRPRRIRCSTAEVIEALSAPLKVITAEWQANPGEIIAGKIGMEYDFAVVGCNVDLSRVWFKYSAVQLVERAVARVEPRKMTLRQWDTVLTPYTPANTVGRVTLDSDTATVELGSTDKASILSDLNYVFQDGFALRELSPITLHAWDRRTMPENVVCLPQPCGLVSRTDEVVELAYTLLRRWTRRKANGRQN